MAKAFLRAEEVAHIAAKEIERLDQEREKAKEEWISTRVGKPVLRGHLWRKHIHIQTQGEVEDIYYGRGTDDWYPPAVCVRSRFGARTKMMSDIRKSALGAIEHGDKTVMLDHDEIAAIRAAREANS
jgi:hypothetical protein